MFLDTKLINQIKPLVFMAIIFPSFLWSYQFFVGNLGINPIDKLMDKLGEFALQLIILVFIISNLSKL